MKTFRFQTRKKPVQVVIQLESEQPVELFITGYDPRSPRTEYFSRRIEINGEDQVEFNCPQSPNILKVIIWSAGNGKFAVPDIKIHSLNNVNNFTESGRQSDVAFIEKFARRSGRLHPYYFYKHKGARFKIHYLPVIRKDNGDPHPTPARIHVSLPIIQVSKKHFNKMTVPQRVTILLHEYSHNFMNFDQDSEFEADENAMNMYTQMKYPRLEAIYAFANVMPDTDTNVARVKNLTRRL